MTLTDDNQLTLRWIFTDEEVNNAPTISPACTPKQERQFRRDACAFVLDLVDRLNQWSTPADAQYRMTVGMGVSAALIHVQRFFMFHSFDDLDYRDIAAVITFVTSKSNECPQVLDKILKIWHDMKFPKDQNPLSSKSDKYAEYTAYFNVLEHIVLMTISFDLNINVPHRYCLTFAQSDYFKKVLQYNAKRSPPLGENVNHKMIAEAAYSFATDILHVTTLVLRYSAPHLAAICLYCAITHAGIEMLPEHEKFGREWWRQISPTLDKETIERLAEEFLTEFETSGLSDSKHRQRARRLMKPHDAKADKKVVSNENQGASENIKRVKTEPAIKMDPKMYLERKRHAHPADPAAPPMKLDSNETSSLEGEVIASTASNAAHGHQSSDISIDTTDGWMPQASLPPPPIPPKVEGGHQQKTTAHINQQYSSNRSTSRDRSNDSRHRRDSYNQRSGSHDRRRDRTRFFDRSPKRITINRTCNKRFEDEELFDFRHQSRQNCYQRTESRKHENYRNQHQSNRDNRQNYSNRNKSPRIHHHNAPPSRPPPDTSSRQATDRDSMREALNKSLISPPTQDRSDNRHSSQPPQISATVANFLGPPPPPPMHDDEQHPNKPKLEQTAEDLEEGEISD